MRHDPQNTGTQARHHPQNTVIQIRHHPQNTGKQTWHFSQNTGTMKTDQHHFKVTLLYCNCHMN